MSADVSFDALVLAGSRPDGDPVASHCGVASKAQVSVGERPLLWRVIDALAASPSVARTTVIGLPAAALEDRTFAEGLEERGVALRPGAATPAASVAAALANSPDDASVLVTTGDHALLDPPIVEAFLAGAATGGADVSYGLVRHERVEALLPGMRRTVLGFRDGGYCGCNLFAFHTRRGRGAAGFWQGLEAHRKHPLRIARILGPLTLIRYVTRRLTLAQGFARLSALCEADVRPVLLPYGEAAVDVDRPEDLAVAERLLAARASQSAASGSQSSSRNAPLEAS